MLMPKRKRRDVRAAPRPQASSSWRGDAFALVGGMPSKLVACGGAHSLGYGTDSVLPIKQEDVMSKFTSAIIGAIIGSAIFLGVGIGLAHAHTAPQQTGSVVYVEEP